MKVAEGTKLPWAGYDAIKRGNLEDLWVSPPGLDLSFVGSYGEYYCMWSCPRPGLNPSGPVNNESLAAGPQFTEVKIS